MLWCVFPFILSPRKERFLQSKIKSHRVSDTELQCPTICTQSHDVGKLIDRNLSDSKINNGAYSIVVMNCLRYLAGQGTAIQGTHGEDNFTHLLKLMGKKYSTITNKLKTR